MNDVWWCWYNVLGEPRQAGPYFSLDLAWHHYRDVTGYNDVEGVGIRNSSRFPVDIKHIENVVNETAKDHDKVDATATDGSSIPLYSALGLAGETGEVVELVKKAARHLTPVDKTKGAMELGDVQWYIARMADRLCVPLAAVVEIMEMKLKRRNVLGKDDEAEYKIARKILERHGVKL